MLHVTIDLYIMNVCLVYVVHWSCMSMWIYFSSTSVTKRRNRQEEREENEQKEAQDTFLPLGCMVVSARERRRVGLVLRIGRWRGDSGRGPPQRVLLHDRRRDTLGKHLMLCSLLLFTRRPTLAIPPHHDNRSSRIDDDTARNGDTDNSARGQSSFAALVGSVTIAGLLSARVAVWILDTVSRRRTIGARIW